jgi:predicted dehydrogenase
LTRVAKRAKGRVWEVETVSDTISVGVVGCGNVSTRFHLPAYLMRPQRFRVVALADPSPERLAEARTVVGLTEDRCFKDARDLAQLPDVDVVDICSPQRFHAQSALAAAAVGKHILTEKPIATVPADAQAMIEAARQAGVILGVMHNYLFFPELVAARRILASGEIGDVRVALLNYLGVPDLPGAESFRPSWRHDPIASGGGILMDMLHVLYVAEDLLGGRAERVSSYISGRGGDTSVEALALCRLETDGPTGLVNVGWGHGPGGIVVEGDEGSIEIGYRNGGTSPFEPFEALVVKTGRGARREPLPPGKETGPLVIEAVGAVFDDFAQAILGGHPPVASGEDGLHALEVTLAAYESAALGCSVAVPLARSDPLFRGGVAAIRELGGPDWSPVRRQSLFRVESDVSQ